MLYSLLKVVVNLAAKIFCRKIVINKPVLLKEKGPLLLACNHPNSFLDAVILALLFEQPVWSLARGDAFINKTVNSLLNTLHMLPLYRAGETNEVHTENYKTFDACMEIFRENGIVLIFSEGICINEWRLRPLKKGTARLAIRCRAENIPLKILPVGINYSSFTRFGKNVFIRFGRLFTMDAFDDTAAGRLNEPIKNEGRLLRKSEGLKYQAFNSRLQKELAPLVLEIDSRDKQKQKELLEIKPSSFLRALLALPAAIGWLLHAPLYLPLKKMVRRKYKGTVYFDSVLTALLVFTYPVYLLLLVLLAFLFIKSWWVLLLVLLLPFTAWSYVQVKSQVDR